MVNIWLDNKVYDKLVNGETVDIVVETQSKGPIIAKLATDRVDDRKHAEAVLNSIKRFTDLNNLPDMRKSSLFCSDTKKRFPMHICNACVDNEICAFRKIASIIEEFN